MGPFFRELELRDWIGHDSDNSISENMSDFIWRTSSQRMGRTLFEERKLTEWVGHYSENVS